MYNRKVAAYDQKKLTAFDESRVEEFGSRSLPYTSQSHRKKPQSRRKRKKVEYSTDTAAYMANHNLFSYRENKKSDQDGTSTGDDLGNPVCTVQNSTGNDEFPLHDDWSIPEENINFEEQILRKIELMHSRVHKLKAQLDSVMTKYAGKFSSSESLTHLVPYDAQTSSVRSPTLSACNGDTVSVGGLYASFPQMSEYELGDFVLPDAAVSNYGDDILIPDIIESTVGLLSSADVTEHHQSQVGDSCEKIVDNILIHNEEVEMEIQALKQSHNQDAEISEDETTTNPSLPSEDQVPKTTTMSQGQSSLKQCLASDIKFPKSKRKRGERKAGSGSWSRQVAGEPESQ